MSGALLPGQFATQLGYVQMTTILAATALVVPVGATYALLQAEAQDVRWRDDGTNPTTTVGMLLKAGQDPSGFTGDQIKAMLVIQSTAGAILNISYYK